jgi:recombination protein RecT
MAQELTVTQKKAITVRDYINQPHVVKQLEAALPSFLNADTFLRTCWTAMLRNPKLQDCTKESMLGAMIESAQLGLPPVLGKAALIPYGKEMQFQPMYRGLIDLGRRTGDVKVTAHVVYSKDEFDIEYGDNEKCYHKPYLFGDRGEKLGAYTVWTFDNGTQSFLFLPTVDILHVRDTYSKSWKQSGKDSVWGKSEDEMFKKTVIKNHSKLQPCSIEMERAVELDHRVETGLSQSDMFEKLPNLRSVEESTDLTDLIIQFDAGIPQGIDLEALQKFLAVCAKHFDKPVEEIKAEATKDLEGFWHQFKTWEKKEKPTKEEAIRKLYKGLGDKNFKKFVTSCLDEIPTYPQVNQDEIQIGWGKRFKDEPYPGPGEQIKEPKTPTGPNANLEPETPADETDEEKFMRLVDGAEKGPFLDGEAIFVKCLNREEDEKPTVMWCKKNCKDRENCPTWTEFDKE